MSTFTLPERTATLVFEDGPLHGLEVEVLLSLSFDALFKMQRLADASIKEASLDSINELLRFFAGSMLRGWNLTDANGPVPCTPDAFTATLDPINGGLLLARYLQAVGQVPAPLAARSRNGSTSKARRASSSQAS